MLSKFQNGFSLAARVLIASLFLPAGLAKISGFAGTVGYISSVGLPMATLGAVIAIVVEAGGGLALLAGFQARWVALLMAAFTVVTGLVFHQFWAVPAEQVMVNQIMFFKNLSIAGGLLMISAYGAGAFSVDAKRAAA